MKNITKLLVIVLVVLGCVLMAIAGGKATLAVVNATGTMTNTVQGQSMEPTIHARDLTFYRDDIEPVVGDIVVYEVEPETHMEGKSRICHRIVGESFAESGGWVVRGDNNEANDPLVEYDQVVGVVTATVPALGFLSPIGMDYVWLAILGVQTLVCAYLLWTLRKHHFEEGE